jgi:anti-sigma factor RsiW
MRAAMSAPGDMTCIELVEVVTDYLDGALPARDRVALERHLDECPYCREYVEQMRQTAAALGQTEPVKLSPAAEERLLAEFRGWRDA